MDEAFYGQLEAALKSQALVLLGDFNYPDIYRRSNTVKHKQYRRFVENGKMESRDYNFPSQEGDNPTRNAALFDLTLTNREGLVADVNIHRFRPFFF